MPDNDGRDNHWHLRNIFNGDLTPFRHVNTQHLFPRAQRSVSHKHRHLTKWNLACEKKSSHNLWLQHFLLPGKSNTGKRSDCSACQSFMYFGCCGGNGCELEKKHSANASTTPGTWGSSFRSSVEHQPCDKSSQRSKLNWGYWAEASEDVCQTKPVWSWNPINSTVAATCGSFTSFTSGSSASACVIAIRSCRSGLLRANICKISLNLEENKETRRTSMGLPTITGSDKSTHPLFFLTFASLRRWCSEKEIRWAKR